MDLFGVMSIEPPEVDYLTRRVDLRLERRFALAEHRGPVDHGAPARRKEVGGFEKDCGPIGQAPTRPVAPRLARRFHRGCDFLRTSLMDFGEHMLVTVRHHRVDRLAGPDFLAADDDGDLDLTAAQVLERQFELVALA